METGLNINQTQGLQQTLSPMQVQYVRMLEMNGHEIEDEVTKALEENPALEVAADDNAEPPEEFTETPEEFQMADYRNEEDIPHLSPFAGSGGGADSYYEPVAVAGEGSLMEQLMTQLAQMPLTDRQMKLAAIITGNIDDNGYMTRSAESIADDAAISEGIDATTEEVEEVMEIVKSLDPPGVGASDLRECLLIQLRARPADDAATSLATEIIERHYDLFTKMDSDRLRRALRTSADALSAAMDVIRSLNPKPGSAAAGTNAAEDKMRQITPDFLVEADDGDLTLTLLNRLPALQVSRTFADAEVEVGPRATNRQKDGLAFIRRSRDDAASFIAAMTMRQETLSRVMTAIMKIQRRFFLTEDELDLRPMILKDISAITGDDVSVVSRATNGKYVATRNRVYPLRFFFSERAGDDTDASSREIIAVLRQIIDAEDKRHPLSDEALTAALRERGYDIARRTVAKYRERERIPVARLRRPV